jgi:hypothetical protein
VLHGSLLVSKARGGRRRTAKQLRRHLVAGLQQVQARMHPAWCLAPNTRRPPSGAAWTRKNGRPNPGGLVVRWELAGKWPLAADRYDPLRKVFFARQIAASVRYRSRDRLAPRWRPCFPQEAQAAERWRQCTVEPTGRKPRLTDFATAVHQKSRFSGHSALPKAQKVHRLSA